MPHFIIACSDNIITKISPNDIMKAVYDTAQATGLFASGHIKVRLRPFQYLQIGRQQGKLHSPFWVYYILNCLSLHFKLNYILSAEPEFHKELSTKKNATSPIYPLPFYNLLKKFKCQTFIMH